MAEPPGRLHRLPTLPIPPIKLEGYQLAPKASGNGALNKAIDEVLGGIGQMEIPLPLPGQPTVSRACVPRARWWWNQPKMVSSIEAGCFMSGISTGRLRHHSLTYGG
jgi:hypothetical protein